MDAASPTTNPSRFVGLRSVIVWANVAFVSGYYAGFPLFHTPDGAHLNTKTTAVR
jgi:hypothetical protein